MKKKSLFTLIAIMGAMVIGATTMVVQAEVEKAGVIELLETTPLNNYSYFYSLDNFPKYKVEAAEMVEELMAEGVSEQEACLTAIDKTSDKIYEDTLEFYEQQNYGWDVEPEIKEAELNEFMAEKQQ